MKSIENVCQTVIRSPSDLRFMLLSVIIPTYRRFEQLLDTVDDVLAQDWNELEVLVMDQNSEWPLEYAVRQRELRTDSRVRWFTLHSRGVVRARNQAAMEARGEILVFVDDDVVIEDSGFLRRHASNYSDPDVAAVAGRECPRGTPLSSEPGVVPIAPLQATQVYDRRSRLDCVFRFSRESTERFRVHTFCTCNGSIRRSVFIQLGGFDESFAGNSYGDDFDLALRMADEGLEIVYDPGCWLVHLQAPQGGLRLSDPSNPAKESERAISPCVFLLKHFEWRYSYTLIVKHVLRKTVFRKDNVFHPWRQPAAWIGLIQGFARATHQVLSGPILPLKP